MSTPQTPAVPGEDRRVTRAREVLDKHLVDAAMTTLRSLLVYVDEQQVGLRP